MIHTKIALPLSDGRRNISCANTIVCMYIRRKKKMGLDIPELDLAYELREWSFKSIILSARTLRAHRRVPDLLVWFKTLPLLLIAFVLRFLSITSQIATNPTSEPKTQNAILISQNSKLPPILSCWAMLYFRNTAIYLPNIAQLKPPTRSNSTQCNKDITQFEKQISAHDITLP